MIIEVAPSVASGANSDGSKYRLVETKIKSMIIVVIARKGIWRQSVAQKPNRRIIDNLGSICTQKRQSIVSDSPKLECIASANTVAIV